MPDRVFWDTAAFVALGNRDDDLHGAAIGVSQELAARQAMVLTHDAILTEVANSFSKAAWRSVARRIIDDLTESVNLGVAEIVHIDTRLWRQGWDLFVSRRDKDWGLTDCLSFVVMQENNLTSAFTSDRHFEQAGFTRLLIRS
jgi:predicted nucleic acid-binding protein